MPSKLEQFLSQVLSEERRNKTLDKTLNDLAGVFYVQDVEHRMEQGYCARDQDVKALVEMLREAIAQRNIWIHGHCEETGAEKCKIRGDKALEAIAERAMKECGE